MGRKITSSSTGNEPPIPSALTARLKQKDSFARWLAADDLKIRSDLNPLRLSERHIRLVAVGFCRDIWEFMTDARSRSAVEVAERFADGRANNRERAKAYQGYRGAYRDFREEYRDELSPAARVAAQAAETVRFAIDPWPNAWEAANCAAGVVRPGVAWGDAAERLLVRERQVRLLVAMVGPGDGLRPEWRTTDAVALARTAYEDKDWSAMPILADALQDAGCENEDVLGHCRGDGPFVRGDWVLDALLGLN